MNIRRYTVLGFVATLVITASSAMRGWPFPTLTAEPWLFQINGGSNPIRYVFLVVFYAAVALLSFCWYRFCQAAGAGELTSRQVVAAFCLWSLPLFFCVPLFSGDVYVYWVSGLLVTRGFDMYGVGISALGPVDSVYMIHPLWRDTTTMYGPLFVRIAQGVAYLTSDSVIAGVTLFRFVAIAFLTLMSVSMASILRRLGRPVPQGLVFGLLNPITMLHLVGGAHNDAMMLGFLFAGFAVGLKTISWGRSAAPKSAAVIWTLRFVALSLSAGAGAFKIPGFAGALVLGWIWAGKDVSVLRRVIGAALAGLVALFAFELETLATGLGWGWLNAISVPGLAHPILSPPNAVAFSFGFPFNGGIGINGVTRALATLFALLLSAFLLLRTGRRSSPEDSMRALAWALLIVAWTGPAVYPWYLAWGVAMAGTVGLHSMRKPLILATIAVNFFVLPGGYGTLDQFTDWRRTIVAFVVVAGYGVMAYHLYQRAHSGGYLSFNGPNWRANKAATSESPSLTSPLATNPRN